MVYISDFDILKGGKTIYHCRTVTDETSQRLENGLTEIYVNTKVDDGSEISELIHQKESLIISYITGNEKSFSANYFEDIGRAENANDRRS